MPSRPLLTLFFVLVLFCSTVQSHFLFLSGIQYLKRVALQKFDFLTGLALQNFLDTSPTNHKPSFLSDTNSSPEEIPSVTTVEAPKESQIAKIGHSTEDMFMIKNRVLEEEHKTSLGNEIMHILVMIVIVMCGIGAIVAFFALLAFLYSYFRRRFYVHAGKRAGSEHILLQDNTHDFNLSPSVRKSTLN